MSTPSLYEVITRALIEHFGLECLPMQATRFACDKYTVTCDALREAECALVECLAEITRLNQAAGHTVFNPAAVDLAKSALSAISSLKGRRKA